MSGHCRILFQAGSPLLMSLGAFTISLSLLEHIVWPRCATMKLPATNLVHAHAYSAPRPENVASFL